MADNDQSWQSQAIPVLAPTGGNDSGSSLSQYSDTFTQAEERYGLPKNLLTAISMQENVAPHHNNPLGLSTDAGVKSFSTAEEANSAIMRQAELMTNPNGPYGKFARTRNIDDLAAVYSPVGASNDIYGTNATEASGIRANLQKLGSDWRAEAVPVRPEEQDWREQAVRVEQPKVSDWQGQAKLQAAHPVAQQKGFDLVSWVNGLLDVAKRDSASQTLGRLTGQQADKAQYGTLGSDPYEERIKEVQIDPNLNAQQRDETIASIRVEQAREQQKKVASIPQAQKDLQEAQAKVQKEHPDWGQETIAGLLTMAPNIGAGPAAPFTMAQQAIAQTYGDQLDGAVKKYKEVHPGSSDQKAYTEAVKAVSDAAKASGGSMLALGLMGDVPAIGGTVARIAQKIGWGAATMEVANTLAEFEKNNAFQKYVDPKQELTDRIKDLDFHVQNMTIGGVFGGLHGLGELGRPSHVPIEDRVPIAEVPDTSEELTPSEKAKRETAESLAQAYKEFGSQDLEERLPRGYHFETDENGMTWTVAPDGSKVQGKQIPMGEGTEPKSTEPEKVVAAASRKGTEVRTGAFHAESMGDWDIDESEQGFVTNKGRFVTREEAHELASGKPGSLYAEQLGTGGEVKEYKDPYEEAKRIVLQTHQKLSANNPNVGINEVAGALGVDPQEIQGDYDKLVEEGKIGQAPVTGTDPWLSSIANQYVEPRVEAGEIGEVTPGKGTTPEAVLARGTAMKPEEVAQHVSDLMQGKGSVDQVAALRAEEARLSRESWRLSRIAEANPNDPVAQRNAEDAHKYVTDFHNGPIKKLKENWAQTGHGLQKEVEVDLGSFNGLREQWLREVGKEPDKNVQQKMRDTARKVREAQASEKIAMETLGKEIDRQTSRRKLPTEEQVRQNILARMRGDEPCGI